MLFDSVSMIRALARSSATHVIKPWGEEVFVDTGEFIVKCIHINEGCRTSKQYHERKEEVLVIVGGTGHIDCDNIPYNGAAPFHIMPGVVHRSVGPLVLLEVTTSDNDDVVRVEDDYGR